MGDEQRFTEDEVNAILSRAVDLERTGASSPGVVGSLSLAEIKEVAGEAGIAPSLVETAAAEFMIAAPPGPATWLGSSERSRATRLVDTTLAVEDVGLLLRLVEDRLSQHGMVSDALGRVTWVSQSAQLTTEVSISEQGGGARIDVEGRYPGRLRPLLHLFPGALGMTLAASIAAPAGIFGIPLVALAVGGGALGAAVGRGIWELVARATAAKTQNLADEIASAAVDLGDPGPGQPIEPGR